LQDYPRRELPKWHTTPLGGLWLLTFFHGWGRGFVVTPRQAKATKTDCEAIGFGLLAGE